MKTAERRKIKIMDNSNSSSGIGLFGLTFIVFLVLKLTHVIDWSWWWVAAPIWGGIVIGIIVWGIIALLVSIFK